MVCIPALVEASGKHGVERYEDDIRTEVAA